MRWFVRLADTSVFVRGAWSSLPTPRGLRQRARGAAGSLASGGPDRVPTHSVPARVLVLAAGTFAIGTDAFVVAGILPDIADSLRVSVAEAGQLVTVFSLAYALLCPVMATLTGSWPRRWVLLSGLVVLALGNVATALAPSYGWVLAARVPAAVGAALFTPAAGAAAAALVAPEYRARALSYVSVGLVSSTVLGVPLGALLGHTISWRGTMWFVAGFAALAALGVALSLPTIPIPPPLGLRQRLVPLGDRRVMGLLLTTVLGSVGVHMVYSYIAVILRPATGGDVGFLAILLAVSGVAGTAGTLTTARLTDRFGPRRMINAVMTVLGITLALVSVAATSPAAATILMVVL